ncbi:MAG: radical SAM protein [Candidatus Omnitrophica bacterium]|nr:radical SAM protein [Candidatus Omnitrophota bacterium]
MAKKKHFLQNPFFIIQWHITERCNWQCKHCYQDKAPVPELPFGKLEGVLGQCMELFKTLNVPAKQAYMHIGGGEPFLRKDFFKFLKLLSVHNDYLRIQIMTNGSLLTQSVVKELKRMKVNAVQVSLEGFEQTNDQIRGPGSFNKALRAIELLIKNKISTRVSLTLTRMNLNEIDDLAVYLKSLGVRSFGIRRYFPEGEGGQLKEFMLSPLEMKEYYLRREALKKKLDVPGKFWVSKVCEDACYLSSQDQSCPSCGITRGCHLNIFTNGDILACRRCPIVVGNVLKDRLLDVYFSSDTLWALRNLDNVNPECRKCTYFDRCLGGAKCESYSYFNNPFAPDPQCFRLFTDLPDPQRYNRQAEKMEVQKVSAFKGEKKFTDEIEDVI